MDNWSHWAQKCNFEDVMVDMQPEHDMIYGSVNRGTSSWHGNDTLLNETYVKHHDNSFPNKYTDPKMEIKIRDLTRRNQNELGQQQNDDDDVNEDTNREKEILNMIRNCGLEPAIDQNLSSKNTLPVVQNGNAKYRMNGRSKFMVFLDESYFKLKPKKKEDKKDHLAIEKVGNELEKSVSTSGSELDKSINITKNDSEKSISTKRNASKKAIFTNLNESETAIHTKESQTNLLHYYQKIKFYTPREIYYKKKGSVSSSP